MVGDQSTDREINGHLPSRNLPDERSHPLPFPGRQRLSCQVLTELTSPTTRKRIDALPVTPIWPSFIVWIFDSVRSGDQDDLRGFRHARHPDPRRQPGSSVGDALAVEASVRPAQTSTILRCWKVPVDPGGC